MVVVSHPWRVLLSFLVRFLHEVQPLGFISFDVLYVGIWLPVELTCACHLVNI